MKLAYFTDTYLPNKDGVVTSIVNFRRELEKRGHEVYIFSSGSRQAKKENRDSHVFYHSSATFRPYPQYKVALFPFLSSPKVKSLGIDIVHSHGLATMGLAAYAASRSLKLPSVATFHTLVPEAMHYISNVQVVKRMASGAAWKYLKWYYGLFDETTAPSRYTAALLAEHKINSRVLPNGIDTKRFRLGISAAAFKKHHGLEGKTVFMHVGRLAREKNLSLLIDSALMVKEEIPDAAFVFVGAGPAAELYKKEAREKGVAKLFHFTGFVPDALLPAAYSACDVFAFPSEFETQGLVALEAMACGKPLACAAKSAASELVGEGKTGFIFNQDASDCADKLVLCAQHSKKMANAARKKASEYSVEKCTGKLLALYKKML